CRERHPSSVLETPTPETRPQGSYRRSEQRCAGCGGNLGQRWHDDRSEDTLMSFTDAQTKLLSGKLNEKHVKTREQRGLKLSYVEGWHTIAEANRVFGFDGWDRETVVA